MTRTLWITALISALVCVVGAGAICVLALVEHKHLGLAGGFVFTSSALMMWVALGYVRFRLREAAYEREMNETVSALPRNGIGYLADMDGSGAATATHDLGTGTEPFRR